MAIAPDDYMVVQYHAERGRGFFDVLGHGDVGLPNRDFFAALQGIKSGDQGSFRRDQGIRFRPLFGLPPDDKSDRSKSRKPDLELDAGFCPCERRARHAEIARRARRRERSAFRASRWRHRSRRAPPAAPSSTVAGGPSVRIHLPPPASQCELNS